MKKLLAAAAVLAVAATPAALAKGKPEDPGSKGKGHTKPAKGKNVVVKGTVVSSDANSLVVLVPAPKGKGKGQAKKPSGELTFVITTAKLTVADTNADTKIDGTDLKAGDKVVVQSRVADGVYTARHVVDQTNPPAEDEDETAPVEPAPVG